MESTGAAATKRNLARRTSSSSSSSSSSFRLRCPSLNSLRIRRVFDIFDKNNDGVITLDELSQALNLLGLYADMSELDLMVRSYVQLGNNGLKFEDFEALHRSLNDVFFGFDFEEERDDIDHEMLVETEEDGAAYSYDDICSCNINSLKEEQEESDLTEAFKVFDEDGDGYISARELQIVLSKLGLPEGREIDRVEKMILSFDTNHDGRVDFFEFKAMMRTAIVPVSPTSSSS